ncbi:MAG: hypothetical protein A2Y64_05540 [Candidatus Coatesbacteria bacterium RBG_13_66_14]|uniref:DUF488 domain-containing protein n=1 Tax=Candidatus Coatesbacteria bacterium RBG_13_66_14 TaxID=1817816 RepID=A0A1F5FGM1_9BACT|nr:MAG: hypothetical protein A2Y64_05540 [Candidatus Coatesbacteria bacterium RBG_13_66_14]
MGHIFTIGYEGASLVSFIGTLRCEGIKALLDVRRDPVSRRPEFRKRALEAALAEAGIAYRHEPRLGVPRDVRERFRDAVDPAGFAAWYAAEVLGKQSDLLRELTLSVGSTPTALLCYEADPARCHRSLLALELARLTGLPVRHLDPKRWNSDPAAFV